MFVVSLRGFIGFSTIPKYRHRQEARDSFGMNESVFHEIFTAHYKSVYNYVYGRLQKREAAEDVTEEVFLSVWQNLSGFDAKKGSMATWLYAIAANKSANYLKQAYLRHEISVTEIPDQADGTMFLNPRNRTSFRILSRLTDAEREFLMMRYEMGLSNHEVAQMLGKSPGSVSARYSRLLKKCRNLCMEGRR